MEPKNYDYYFKDQNTGEILSYKEEGKTPVIRDASATIDSLILAYKDLKFKQIKEIFDLQQSYRLQFDWIKENYPECYKNIPNPVDPSEHIQVIDRLKGRIDELEQSYYDQEHYINNQMNEISRLKDMIKMAYNFARESLFRSDKVWTWEEYAKENDLT